MSYWKTPTTNTSTIGLDSVSLSGKIKQKKSNTDEFYEIEPGIVLDIILDKNHVYIQNNKYKIEPSQWPVSADGSPPLNTDLDYTWIGRCLVRLVYSEDNVEKENLIWATPLESNISEYPLINEIVGVVYYLGKYYYTKKINKFNTPNANVDLNAEIEFGGFRRNTLSLVEGNRELSINYPDKRTEYIGPKSKLNSVGSIGYTGALGRYFYYNTKIRSLKRREGDFIIESRFGQSIRFGSYDDDRNNDKGYINGVFGGYAEYKGNGVINPYSKTEAGGGNPMILVRNRQRPLNPSNVDEKNVGGYLLEDINNDGTSVHITCGVTLSSFQTKCIKKMWGNGSEEQSKFNGITSFKFPQLMGDQIIINSDRVILSSKKNEMFQFSKKRMSFVTDDEFTIDAQNQIIITTNNKTVFNSPAIYLGQYDETNEPVLLGKTTINWLYDFCDLIIKHTHWYNHKHPDAQGGTTGNSDPNQTQNSVQVAEMIVMRENLNLLLSRRVFLTGAGLSAGANGGTISDGSAPVNISTVTGNGVPGGWKAS